MNRELPAMQSSAYASAAYDPTMFANQTAQVQGLVRPTSTAGLEDWRAAIGHAAQPLAFGRQTQYAVDPASLITVEKEPIMARRLVQILIADTNASVPLDAALLHRGEPIFTDLDDNELFFDLDIKAMLAAHNEKRVTVVDKAGKDGAKLPAARVRDLKMNVVTIASF